VAKIHKNKKPQTLGELKKAGYRVCSVKTEMRRNLIAKIRKNEDFFPGIVGYEETVIPQLENAILSGQDVIFLGERGQAWSISSTNRFPSLPAARSTITLISPFAKAAMKRSRLWAIGWR